MLHFNCKVHSDAHFIAQTLAAQSRALNITREDIAKHLGVSVNTLRNWIKSPDNMPLGMADRWAKHVNLCGVTLRRPRTAQNHTYAELLIDPSPEDVTAMHTQGTYDAARYEPARGAVRPTKEHYLLE